jgi:hypothetical protein
VSKDQVVEAAGQAVSNLKDPELRLNFAERTSKAGNVWRVSCRRGYSEIEFSICLFPDTLPEEAVKLFQERLAESLKQISS